jgi:hypothetical protein
VDFRQEKSGGKKVTDKPSKLRPAIIGGLVLGILYCIPFVNFCCCLWMVLGGVIASRALVKSSPVYPVKTGDGAVAGALAGVVGALVWLVIGIPIGLLLGEMSLSAMQKLAEVVNDPQVRDQILRGIEESRRQSVGQRLVSNLFIWFIGSVIGIGFASLGGILGVALFEKRKGQPPPPTTWDQPPGTPPGQPPYGGGEPPRY